MPLSQAAFAEPAADPDEAMAPPRLRRLRLASFNIQTGISTSSYREYVTGGWRHILPSQKRLTNLNRIAQVLKPFDLVGLQEVDGGGARSHNIVQTQYLAEHAGFPYWHNQINRRFGNLALHSNGLLTRIRPDAIHDYKLPGAPGRGALLARYGRRADDALYVCVMHLALTTRSRLKQLGFVCELIRDLPYVILMGDLNCEPASPEFALLTRNTRLCDPSCELKTFPSWSPHRMIDHILVTPELRVEHVHVINFKASDHLPIAMDVMVPAQFAAGH